MENCLVKKLKAEIMNDNLPRLGTLVFGIKNASAGWMSSFKMSTGTGVVSYSEGGYVTTGRDSDTKLSDTQNIGTYNINVYSCSGSYNLFFEDGYACDSIVAVSLLNDNISFNISQLKYRKQATYIRIVSSISNINQGTIVGDIEVFSGLTNLTGIGIVGSHNIVGDISVLKDLVKTDNFEFSNTKVHGSYENLLSKMCVNRISGNMYIDCRSSDVTFKNIAVGGNRHRIVFSATGCEVQPYNGGAAIATYTKSNNTWT